MAQSREYPAGTGRWGPGDPAIAHIDMDAFFASVEILDDPTLAGTPLVVGGDTSRGVVAAASYEARRYGIRSAMPIFQAKRLCPGIVIRPGRMTRYVELSREAMKVLHRYSPLVEQIGIDEAYVDLSGTDALFGCPERAIRSIRDDIRAATALTCSAGLSTSTLVAKIASDINKPDGMTIIPPSSVRAFLEGLPVGKVPGIGGKGEERLRAIGVRTVGDLGRLRAGYLEERFGRFGGWLEAVGRGEGRTVLVPWSQPKSISNEITMPEDTGDQATLEKHLLALSDSVGRRMRRQGLRGRTVTLKLKTDRHRLITRSVTLERPFSQGAVIFRDARGLLRRHAGGTVMRLVGVGVSGLEPEDAAGQFSLFDGPSPEEEKWERVERAVDRIVDRFGAGALRRGRELE
ncbi:MAG: DNA polymerase IV [Candidatus Krumholzibacteria bacterium]|nr:DNA polymerase IV [Candidatus Krumholzibacteria bacterium]